MVFTKKVHAYYDVKTSELHRNKVDWEDVIVELESTITKNRINGDSSSGGDFDIDVEGRWERLRLRSFSNSNDTKQLSAPVSNKHEA